ncbi:MAG: DUF433 domain-containing protein [Proteobacteria bacterium]|nr:DUF433 domain-containing protein [Pseudomonadota bacterium]
MSITTDFKPTVVRTNRGLSIAGSRITLYQIMDYIEANEPPEVIRDHFRLTIKQTDDVMDYIQTHYDEVEAEYRKILDQAETNRQYWAKRNKKRFEEIAALPRKPEEKEIWAKLDDWKARIAKKDRQYPYGTR